MQVKNKVWIASQNPRFDIGETNFQFSKKKVTKVDQKKFPKVEEASNLNELKSKSKIEIGNCN